MIKCLFFFRERTLAKLLEGLHLMRPGCWMIKEDFFFWRERRRKMEANRVSSGMWKKEIERWREAKKCRQEEEEKKEKEDEQEIASVLRSRRRRRRAGSLRLTLIEGSATLIVWLDARRTKGRLHLLLLLFLPLLLPAFLGFSTSLPPFFTFQMIRNLPPTFSASLSIR